ncbi:MAG: lpxA [Verrucomicrobiales bacterium]|nr:lpxA [Verrucomicrobiales bacterium]
MIHPTAIIDPRADLAPDVEVGPYCVIGAGVKLGAGCVLHNQVTLNGPTTIGERNTFFTGAVIGGVTQDLKYAGEPTYLEVGDDNVFRECTTVNRGTLPGSKTVIGHHNLFLSYCHIAHDCTVGNHVIFSNNGTLAGHVIVEDHVILGGLSAVHQFCRIGKFAMTGGCSKIVQDVPPFMIVDGNPAAVRGVNVVGLQRQGYDEAAIRPLKQAYKSLFMRPQNLADALAELSPLAAESPALAHLTAFIESSQRGIIR